MAGAFFAMGVGLAGAALLWQGRQTFANSQIVVDNLGQPAEAQETEDEGVEPLSDVRTVLVVGNDTGEVPDEYTGVATGEREGNRTDTIMLLRLDPQAREVTGVGIPRDLYIPLCNGGTGKINSAYSIGGPQCVIDTIRDFSGVSIDHYVEVNFGGFIKIVEAVGGVTLYLDESMQDPKAHLDLPAGCVTLDGPSALGFVRTRADSDFGRIARQQRFIKELADEATSLPVLANPVRLLRLIESVGDAVKMDDHLDAQTLQRFAVTLRDLDSGNMTMGTVRTVTDNSTGEWNELPVETEAAALFDAFERGELAAYLGEEPEAKESEPAEVESEPGIHLDDIPPLVILNSTSVDGLAAETQQAVQELGFQVSTVDNASGPELRNSVIEYPSGLRKEAEFLESTLFPGAELEESSSSNELSIVLGRAYDPSQIRELPPSATAEPTPQDAETESDQPEEETEYKNAQRPSGQEDC